SRTHCAGAHIRNGYSLPVPQAGRHCGHLGRRGSEDQYDGKVHELGTQSTDERHVTHTDRGEGRIYSGASHREAREYTRRHGGLFEQTMPHQTFEEVVLTHLDAAFTYARWLTKERCWR